MANRSVLDNPDPRREQQGRSIPDADAVSFDNVNPSAPAVVPGTTPMPPPEVKSDVDILSEVVADTERINIPPINYQLPEPPAFLTSPVPEGADFQRIFQGVNAAAAVDELYPIDDIQASLASSPTTRLGLSRVPSGDFPVLDPSSYNVEDSWVQRAASAQEMMTRRARSPLLGVTNSINDGQPFSPASEQSAIDFFRRTMGVDFTGIETNNEPVRPPNTLQRILGNGLRGAIRGLTPGLNMVGEGVEAVTGIDVNQALDNLLFGAEDVAYSSRIAAEAGVLAAERAQRRIDTVGLGGFIRENTIGVGSSLARSIMREANPVSVFRRSGQLGTALTGVGIEDGRVVYGVDNPQQFYGLQGEQESPNPRTTSFFGELAQRSPELRNIIRNLEPTLNEAGELAFNPAAGNFGEFGSAGSLSAMLWLLNMPEGLVTGALYDITDMARYLTHDNRVGEWLGEHVNPLYNVAPTLEQAERIDTLSALFGRDTSFTQSWSEDKYLALIDNPALPYVPRAGEIALGFVADMAVGAFTDFTLVDPIWDGLTGARRLSTAARRARANSPVYRTLFGPFSSQGDEVSETISRNVNDVIRLSDNTSANTIEDINGALDNTIRNFDSLPAVDRSLRSNVDLFTPEPRRVQNIPVDNLRRLDEANLADAVRLYDDVGRRVSRINELEAQVDSLRRQIGSTTGEFAEEVRDSLRRSLNNIQEEQRTIVAQMSGDEYTAFVNDFTTRVSSQGTIEITPTGRLIETAESTELDTFFPPVPLEQTRPGLITPASLQFDLASKPFDINPGDLLVRRRDDRQLAGLARLTLDDTVRYEEIDFSSAENFLQQQELSNFLTSDLSTPEVLSEVSNIFRSESLALRDPATLARYGKPLSPNVAEPTNRIVVSNPSPLSPVRQSVIPESKPLEVVRRTRENSATLEDIQFAQRRADQFEGRITRSLERLAEAQLEENTDAILRETARLNVLRSQLYEVYADYPEVAVQTSIRALPDNLRPLSNSASAVAERYVLEQRKFFHETSVLRDMREQLAVVEQQVRGQQRALRLLPPLERKNPASEFATRRNYGLPTYSTPNEFAIPSVDFRADVNRLLTPGTVETLQDLQRRTELRNLSEAQLRRAVDNDPNLLRQGDVVTSAEESIDEDGSLEWSLGPVDLSIRQQDYVDDVSNTYDVSFSVRGSTTEGEGPLPAGSLGKMARRIRQFVEDNPDKRLVATPDGFDGDEVLKKYQFYNRYGFEYVDAEGNVKRNFGVIDTVDDEGTPMRVLSLDGERFRPAFPLMQLVTPGKLIDEPLPPINLFRDELRGLFARADEIMQDFDNALSNGDEAAQMADSVARNADEVAGEASIARQSLSAPEQRELLESQARGDGRQQLNNAVPDTLVDADYYHGTKATEINVEGAQTFSLSNEFGPGLYLTRSREEATRYARATPPHDLTVTGDMRPRFTNQGRVFPVNLPSEQIVVSERFTDDVIGFRILDLDNLADDKALTKQLRDLFRSNLPEEFRQRFFNWSRNKPFDQWYHYIRSQFSKTFGDDSQFAYAQWAVGNNARLSQRVDGIRDSHGNMVILDPTNRFYSASAEDYAPMGDVLSAIEDTQDTGSIAEGLLERYRADLDLHRRLGNSTTKAILEQDRLDIMTYYRNQLADAVGNQEKVAMKAVEDMGAVEEALEAEVRREQKALNRSRQVDMEVDVNRQYGNNVRRADDNYPCY